MAVVVAPGDMLLRRWQGSISIFCLRLEELEVTEVATQAYSRDVERVPVQHRCFRAFLALIGMGKYW